MKSGHKPGYCLITFSLLVSVCVLTVMTGSPWVGVYYASEIRWLSLAGRTWLGGLEDETRFIPRGVSNVFSLIWGRQWDCVYHVEDERIPLWLGAGSQYITSINDEWTVCIYTGCDYMPKILLFPSHLGNWRQDWVYHITERHCDHPLPTYVFSRSVQDHRIWGGYVILHLGTAKTNRLG